MTESTTTLAALRRAIATELRMPFARRFLAGYSALDTGSSASKIIDASLSQKDGFWDGSWFYYPNSQSLSVVRAFNATDDSFQLETPLSGAPANGDAYELHNIFNAADIHAAINRAIKSADRIYFDSVTDQTLVLQENDLSYSISSLSKRPWIVSRVWLENKPTKRGVLASATSTSFTVENSSVLSDVNTATGTWMVSIYAGTGSNQVRAISSVAGAVGNVSAWSTTPNNTSKYAIWNSTSEITDWKLRADWHPDAKEYPDYIYFGNRLPEFYGMRIRLDYIANSQPLSAETDTTIVPSEYIIPKAVSFLYGTMMTDTKVDREVYTSEMQRYNDLAEQYLARNFPQKPDVTLKTAIQTQIYTESSDPLGWRG